MFVNTNPALLRSLLILAFFSSNTVLITAQYGANKDPEAICKSIIQFYEYDHSLHTSAQLVGKQQVPAGTSEKLVISGPYMEEVPAYFVTPDSGNAPYPVILIVDGIYGSKERWFRDDSWPRGGLMMASLLRSGFAVLVMDAVNHGERASDYRYQEPPWLYTYPHAFIRMVVKTGIEYRRAIDYLYTRSDIDTSRIGMMGLSMGSMITFPLAAADARIKTAVAGLTPISDMPALQPADCRIFAPYLQCVSFLMFMGNEDEHYTMEQARKVFSSIQLDDKVFIEYNTDHAPPDEYIKAVTDWFSLHLRN